MREGNETKEGCKVVIMRKREYKILKVKRESE